MRGVELLRKGVHFQIRKPFPYFLCLRVARTDELSYDDALVAILPLETAHHISSHHTPRCPLCAPPRWQRQPPLVGGVYKKKIMKDPEAEKGGSLSERGK